MPGKVIKPDIEWRKQLSPEQYHITREAGTERAFTGVYYDCTIEGTYECVCCGQELFSSEAKFNSGTGWPSFSQPIKENSITERQDISHSMVRTEVICSRCNGHLGHVFSGGPPPTGLRYCINSASLKLNPK